MNEYGISSRDYLARARVQLDSSAYEGLFYAAFELRCGIQARMQQYLEAHEDVARRKKNEWHIGKLGRSVEQAFRLGDRIAEVTVCDSKTSEALEVFYYTPVTSRLRKRGEQLGDLLHAMRKRRPLSDSWWQTTRDVLEDTLRQLEIANRGTLLGPLLREKGGDTVHMYAEAFDATPAKRLVGRLTIGTQTIIRVRYLDQLEASTR